MRRMRFVLAGLTVLLPAVSCTDTLEKAAAEDGGEVMITLSSEARVQPVIKAGPAEVPTGEFTVEIFKLDGESEVRLYRDSYSNTEGKTIGLNTGDYRLYAYYGDPDAAGFDAPYYAAQTPFTVQAGQAETVSAVAKLSNVMVTVEFGETLRLDYPEFYAIVRSGEDVSLQFGKDETREGYVPAGTVGRAGRLNDGSLSPVDHKGKKVHLLDQGVLVDVSGHDYCLVFRRPCRRVSRKGSGCLQNDVEEQKKGGVGYFV